MKRRPSGAPVASATTEVHNTLKKRPADAAASTGKRLIRKTAPVSSAAKLPHAVVVSLARRMDRWDELRTKLDRLENGITFERMDAVDGVGGADIPTSDVALRWSTGKNWRYVTKVFEGGEECGYEVVDLALTGGERGCGASHIAAWRRCATADSNTPLMVLEDDALPLKAFVGRTKLALEQLSAEGEEPDLLYLGYTQAAPWRRRVGSAVCEAEYLWTTVGYIVWPAGARTLLSALPVDQPVDNYMATLMASGKLRSFAVTPAVLKQAKAWNVDNDVKHSDDLAWVQNRT